MQTDFSNQFLKNIQAVASSPSQYTAADSPLSVRSGTQHHGDASSPSSSSSINPRRHQQVFPHSFPPFTSAQQEQQHVNQLKDLITNASPSAPLSASQETSVLRTIVNSIAHHTRSMAAAPLGGGGIPRGGSIASSAFGGAADGEEDGDGSRSPPQASPRGRGNDDLEETLAFGADAAFGVGEGDANSVFAAARGWGAFAGHKPQPMPRNTLTVTLVDHPLANGAADAATQQQPQQKHTVTVNGSAASTNRSHRASSQTGDTNGDADGVKSVAKLNPHQLLGLSPLADAFASALGASDQHHTGPAAFYESHRLYFADEGGCIPDASAIYAATAAAQQGEAQQQEDGGEVKSKDQQGNLSRSDSGNADNAKNSAKVLSPTELQRLSATTMPNANEEFEVNGPRSATPAILKTAGTQPPPPPPQYHYNGPESLYGPYFEPLAWVACGQKVAAAAPFSGGTALQVGSAFFADRDSAAPKQQGMQRPASNGGGGTAAHRRLFAATSSAAAAAEKSSSASFSDAVTVTLNGEVQCTLAEACEVDRQSSTVISFAGIGGGGAPVRDWGSEWRALLLMECATLRGTACRMARLDTLATQFAAFAGPIAQTIIEELRIPIKGGGGGNSSPRQAHKTYKPLSGFPHVYIAKGLVFVVAATPSRKALFGSAEAAGKAAGNEMRIQRVVRGSPHLNSKVLSPLCCLVSALGHKVFVSAPMPIRSPQDIVYGSLPNPPLTGSGGNNHFTTTNFGVMAAYELSELFALGQHKVPLNPTDGHAGADDDRLTSPLAGNKKTAAGLPSSAGAAAASDKSAAQITLPADAKLVYSVADGAVWAMDVARMAPAAACAFASSKVTLKDDTTGKSLSRHPSENNYNAQLSVLFRPEFLRLHAMGSTNPDAGLRCQPKSEHEHLAFMINNLYCVNIPAATQALIALEAKGALKQEAITTVMHSHGVNARYMGKIYNDLESMGSRPLDVRNALRSRLALEMTARTFKALVAQRFTQDDLFTNEQLLDRLGGQHSMTAAERLAKNQTRHRGSGKHKTANPIADEEEIMIRLVRQLLLCEEGAEEKLWAKQMQPLMERKFGAYVCPAKVAEAIAEQVEESVSDTVNLKVYNALGTSGKRRIEKPKSVIQWTELPGGRSVVDEELTQQVQQVRHQAILYPLLGPHALANVAILNRCRQLIRFEISADPRGKELVCTFSHKVQPCTALAFSPTVAALLANATADSQAVLAMKEDSVELRSAVESAARAEMQTYHRIAEYDARSVLPIHLLCKALAHRGQTFPAMLVNRLQEMRKLVPSELVNIITYFQMGELFMLSGRYDRAETAFATGLMRVGQFVAPHGTSSSTQQQTAGGGGNLLQQTQSSSSENAAAASTLTNVTQAMQNAAAAASPNGTTAAAGGVSASRPNGDNAASPISDLHPAGFVPLLASVASAMARITLAGGKRPSVDRTRLVLDYYHYAVYLAEVTNHRLLAQLLHETAMYRRHWATLPRDASLGAGEDGHESVHEHGTVGSRGLSSTKRSRTTTAGGGKRIGGSTVASLSAQQNAAADRNRRATSVASEDVEGNEDNDTFVKKSAANIDAIILPRDRPIYTKLGAFPSLLLADATTSYEFVAQMSLYQGLQPGGGGNVSPPSTALNNTAMSNTMHSIGTVSGPTIVIRDRLDTRERKTPAPSVNFTQTQPMPQASSDPLTNALININLSLNPKLLPQEVRPLLWRVYQLIAATTMMVTGSSAASAAAASTVTASHGFAYVLAPLCVRPAADSTFGDAWVEIGVHDGDSGKIETGLEDITALYGPLSKRVIQCELRLVDVLLSVSKTVCPFTGADSADAVTLGKAERQLQLSLAKILALGYPRCTDVYLFELHAIISRFGTLVQAYSKLPTAKREDAARRYLVDALPPVIGANHILLTDIYDSLRAHYMFLGEVREEAAARATALITASQYALNWLECAVEVKDSEQRIATQLRMFGEKMVKPLRGGTARDRQAAWSFYMRAGAILAEAPFNLSKDQRIKEAMAQLDAAFKSQHRIIVQSEKKALLQKQITEYAREMHLAVRRVQLHKNRMDHYCEMQLRTIEGIGASIRALTADVRDDDVLLKAQDALAFHDEALRIENQMLQRRAQQLDGDEAEEEGGEGKGGDESTSDDIKDPTTEGASKSKDGKDGASKRVLAKAYVSPYECLTSPDDSTAGRIMLNRRSSDASANGLNASLNNGSASAVLNRTRSGLHPMLQPGPAPSSPGGFLPKLQLHGDGANQQAARLLNKVNQSMVGRNHNPVRNL